MCFSPGALCCHANLYKNFKICRCPPQYHNPWHSWQRHSRLRRLLSCFCYQGKQHAGFPSLEAWLCSTSPLGSALRTEGLTVLCGCLLRHMFLRSSCQLPAEELILLTSAEQATSGTAGKGNAVLFWVQTRAKSIGLSREEG